MLAALFGVATVVTLAIAVGWGWPARAANDAVVDDEEDEDADDEAADGDRASAWKGMIVHALLSWKARIGRMLRRAPARTAVRAARPAPAASRNEPRFDALGRVAAPSIATGPAEAEDEEEYEEEAAPAPRRRAPAKVAPRRSGGGFALPSLNLLTAQKLPSAPRCRKT